MEGSLQEVTEKSFLCEGCGATLHYAPGTAVLKCQYCGREHSLQMEAKPIVEHEIAELELVPHTHARGFGMPARQFKCDRCSAITTLPSALMATKCAFCGSDVVIETPPLEGMVAPESIIPFTIPKDNAVQRFQQWLRGLWFRPRDLKHKAALADIDGMYAPHFTFDAKVFSHWTGWAGHYYYATVGRTRARKIRWEYRTGTHQEFYDDVLVCASRGLPSDIIRKVYPYHLNALVPYKPEFLSGFMAEVYTVEPRDAWQIAKATMYDQEVDACSRLLDGDTQRSLKVESSFSNAKWKHLLLPAYVAAYAYGKKVYRFMVNGQTGEVQGEAPLSWLKVAATGAGVAAIVVPLIAKVAGWL